jgi:plastocyanin
MLLAFTVLSLLMILPGCSKDSSSPTATVTEPFESGDMPNGRSFQRTFATAGSFSYRCRFHQGMTGSVHVATGHTDSAVVTITNNAFNPSPALVNPGGYVRWLNQGSTHSVTRP